MIPSQETFHTTYAVVNLDGGEIARGLVDGPLAGLQAAGVADLTPLTTEADARAAVDAGDVSAAIVIPAGFTEAVQAGAPAQLLVIGGPSSLSAEVARSVLAGFGSQVTAVQVAVGTALAAAGEAPDPALAGELAAAALAAPAPIILTAGETADRTASSKTYYGASMAVLFVFFAAQFGVLSLLAERRNGTLARMLAAPIAPATILLGKVLVSMVVASISMTVIVLATTFLMGADWGDPLAVAALVLAVALAASGIATLIVGFARTEEQASSFIAVVALTLAVFGGSFFPMSQAPEGMAAAQPRHPARVVHPRDQRPRGRRRDRGRRAVAGGARGDRRGDRGDRPAAGAPGGGTVNALAIAEVNVRRLLRDRTSTLLRLRPADRAHRRAGHRLRRPGRAADGHRGGRERRPRGRARRRHPRRRREARAQGARHGRRAHGRGRGGHARDRGDHPAGLRRDACGAAASRRSSSSASPRAPSRPCARRSARRSRRRQPWSRPPASPRAGEGIPFDEALATARSVQGEMAGVTVAVERIGEGLFPAGTGAFAPGAQNQLVLFMFLTSMTAATQLILTRQLGVSRRMLASPIRVRTILVGETLGRFGVAMLQGLFIVILSAIIFGVSWGDPLAAGTIVVLFALVGTGAAMVVGVFSNNPDQAGALGVMAGMLLGALGGAMVPLEIFPEPAHTLAFLTPQAWAIQGLREVALRGGTVVDVLQELGVLVLYAVALMAVGTWQFRRILTR